MTNTQYVGKAGHLAVMGELAFRGYNVAMPEIDKGDDIFVVNDNIGAMWRLQVKTSSGRTQGKSSRYQFRIRETAIQFPQTPELHFVFVMRQRRGWRFMIISREVLRNYVENNHLGVLNKGYRQIAVTLNNDGTAICNKQNLTNHMEDWYTWPPA